MVNPVNRILGKAQRDRYSRNLSNKRVKGVYDEMQKDDWFSPEDKTWSGAQSMARSIFATSEGGLDKPLRACPNCRGHNVFEEDRTTKKCLDCGVRNHYR